MLVQHTDVQTLVIVITIQEATVDDGSCSGSFDNNESVAGFGGCQAAVDLLGCSFSWAGAPLSETC